MRGFRLFVFATLGFATVVAVTAQQRSHRKEHMHQVVFEMTAEAPAQWAAVLNNVENLKKAFEPERVEVEIVAHGKALGMLQKTNTGDAARMSRLAAAGVRFAACENTMRRMKVSKSDLYDFAVTVDSGVAEVVRKQEAGWAYIKGGD